MASTANSTRTPSRRRFFGSAVAAGVAAAQPPILTAAVFSADAALVALGGRAIHLIEDAKRFWRDVDAADEMIAEMSGPVPLQPGGPRSYSKPPEGFVKAMRLYEADRSAYDARHAQISERVNREGLEAAAYAADEKMLDACLELAKTRATTLEGLVAKAKAAGDYNRAGLRDSILTDLLAIAASA